VKWGIIKKVSSIEEMLSQLRKKSKLSDLQVMELMGIDNDLPLENILQQSDITRFKLTYLFCHEFVFY